MYELKAIQYAQIKSASKAYFSNIVNGNLVFVLMVYTAYYSIKAVI